MFIAAAMQQQLPLRVLDTDQHRAVLVTMRENYQAMWARHSWRE